MIIEGGAKAAISILLLLSPTSPQAEMNTPSKSVIEKAAAVLPEPLRIPGPQLVEYKKPTGSNPPEGLPRAITGKRFTKVRFS